MPRHTRLSNKRNVATPAWDVDLEGAKLYWRGLDAEAKLRVLRFEDPAILSQVFAVQQELCRADLLCYQLGIRGQDVVRQKVGMDDFVMECAEDPSSKDEVTPTAFYAKPELADRNDLFEYTESRLGCAHLKRRPALRPSDWPSVLETKASSWSDFMNQVLRLVELAMVHAHLETVEKSPSEDAGQGRVLDDSNAPTHGLTLDVVEEEDWDADDVKAVSRKSKKKARKKQRNIVLALASNDSTPANTDASTVPIEDMPKKDDAAESCLPEEAAGFCGVPMNNLQAVEEGSVFEQDDSDSEAGDDWWRFLGETKVETTVILNQEMILNEARGGRLGTVPEGESFLKFDWSTEGQPIDATEEPAVELQMDWSTDGAQPKETFWSAWLPNGKHGSSAEWHWSTTDQDSFLKLRAFVKNTFIDAEDLSDTCSTCSSRDTRLRARSLPAKSRHEFC